MSVVKSMEYVLADSSQTMGWITPMLRLPQVGRLWTALADYFIRQGMFEKARDVYEEGLTTVVTVRDFSLIFDALTTFETSLLEARLAVSAS